MHTHALIFDTRFSREYIDRRLDFRAVCLLLSCVLVAVVWAWPLKQCNVWAVGAVTIPTRRSRAHVTAHERGTPSMRHVPRPPHPPPPAQYPRRIFMWARDQTLFGLSIPLSHSHFSYGLYPVSSSCTRLHTEATNTTQVEPARARLCRLSFVVCRLSFVGLVAPSCS